MPAELQIIPECYVDTSLVSTLLGGIGLNHQKSCNNVITCMKGRFNDGFAVGIIDNDARRPGYLNEFVVVAQSEHLCLLKHHQKHHYIITVSPASEGFIISAAGKAGVSLTDFDLPTTVPGLMKITKHIVSRQDNRLVRLFSVLSNCGEFLLLKEVLSYLVDNKYNADTDILKAFFNGL